tara:strand:- start:449 stop:1027 length:579 start_codon:yes stop_codon:yes gene_type:complete
VIMVDRAEGVLPAEVDVTDMEAYYEEMGAPLLIELLQSKARGAQSFSGYTQTMPQGPTATTPGALAREMQARAAEIADPTTGPSTRLSAAHKLRSAKHSRVQNPGFPNMPAVKQLVDSRMSGQGAPMQQPAAQQPMQQQPVQQQPTQQPMQQQAGSPFSQARKPEVYKPLNAQPAAERPRPMQAIPNQMMGQ